MSAVCQIESVLHEEVYVVTDPSCGLHSIVAIHNTTRGPALGGTRFWDYGSFGEALDDVLLLSRSMTYKAAAAELPLGGGKAVIIGDPPALKSDALFESYGRAIDKIRGNYVTAEDVGTTVTDMAVIGRSTRHVAGLPLESGGSGDPSPATAQGVLAGMKNVVAHLDGSPSLSGMRVAVQGVGKVGSSLVGLLWLEGCEVVLSDVQTEVAQTVASQFEASTVAPAEILSQTCDILVPCALGGAISEETVASLRCRAVVGSANNQLTDDAVADSLAHAGVLYMPDFVVNAGGLINIADELNPGGYSADRALRAVSEIGTTVTTILLSADKYGTTPLVAARELAESRLR
jgi:leucine dehydrogenase